MSSGGSDKEEGDFSRAEKRRMEQEIGAIQPLNGGGMLARGKAGKRQRRDAARADIDPVTVDPVSWESVGGLDHHVQAVKEMVILPLLYPEMYSKFNVTPPRGVLFHGPPGTHCMGIEYAACTA